MTSWLGLFLGIVGCLLGLTAMGMPLWCALVGILVAGMVSMFIGSKQSVELFRNFSESKDSQNP